MGFELTTSWKNHKGNGRLEIKLTYMSKFVNNAQCHNNYSS